MTIAAGYVCDEGIVICADTQETVPGYTKTDSSKLVAIDSLHLNLIFAGAGNNAIQIDETVNEIARETLDKQPTNVREFEIVLRNTLDLLFPKPSYPRDSPNVSLLLAVQTTDEARLYQLSDCNIAPVRKRAAVGCGIVLASQLLQRHYSPDVALIEAGIICTYVLYHVKKWVDGCGGNTDIALVSSRGGTCTILPTNSVAQLEKYCVKYDEAIKDLLIQIPRTPKNKDLFERCVLQARNKLELARTDFQDAEDVMRELAGHMGLDYEGMMRRMEKEVNEFLGTTRSTPQTSADQQ